MSEILSMVGTPDRAAQKLWERVSTASQRVAALIENIPWQTVGGERSRAELNEAGDLLKQAASLLARTAAREELRYMRLERNVRGAASSPKDNPTQP
jgi:hypothetical protein